MSRRATSRWVWCLERRSALRGAIDGMRRSSWCSRRGFGLATSSTSRRAPVVRTRRIIGGMHEAGLPAARRRAHDHGDVHHADLRQRTDNQPAPRPPSCRETVNRPKSCTAAATIRGSGLVRNRDRAGPAECTARMHATQASAPRDGRAAAPLRCETQAVAPYRGIVIGGHPSRGRRRWRARPAARVARRQHRGHES